MIPPLPERRGGWSCVLADPPWTFGDTGTRAAPSYAGGQRAKAHYRVMDLADVVAIDVSRVAALNAFLFLWCPNALVLDGSAGRVARAWGFEMKQLIPWLKTSTSGKPQIGMGHYSRVCTEMLVLCRRGRPKVLDRGVPGVIVAPRGKHSAKPDDSYALIERLVAGPYLELFARRRHSKRWSCWGDQAPDVAATG